MKIKDKVHKNKFKSVVYDVEALYFFVKNAPLTDEFQKVVSNLLDFIYSLDVNNEVEHGQFVYPPAMNSEIALARFNKIMSKKTGVKYRYKNDNVF